MTSRNIDAHGVAHVHVCEGPTDAEVNTGVFESLLLGGPCLFYKDNARPHSTQPAAAVCVLDLAACSPDLSPAEHVRLKYCI